MYMYVYDCKIVSLLLLRVIGIGRPLFRNFGCTFACVCACLSACVRARVCVFVCARVRSSVFCNRSSSEFRYLIDFVRARGCLRACVFVYV